MLKTLRLILIATMGTACFTVAAFAEDAPNCPGGNLKGTFSCTGPITKPVCTEGPPWHCEHPPETDPPKAVITGGGFGGGKHLHFNAIATFDAVAVN